METRSSLSMNKLQRIAAERGLKYYRHLSKSELHALLQRREGGISLPIPPHTPTRSPQEAPSSISPDVKRTKRMRASEEKPKSKKKRKKDVNTLDPIMLTELGPHTFTFHRSNGSKVKYNVDTLVQYILATGDFSEPQTRLPFSDDDLRRMDVKMQAAGLDERSVLEAKQDKHEFDRRKERRDGILGLERCAGDFVCKMLAVVEDEDAEEGELALVMQLFPSFSDVFHQLKTADESYATQCMDHFKAYLRGPKNRPTVDRSGLLSVILQFLDGVAEGAQDASHFGF